ncbi:MAG: biotin--[acetyl-CoA-carboxylase] ligase [Verrucomicrobia bacterium]|nr:biotin--[acetyl-CoA-carboxylase] ligase [Verrucomicrobiota bacterium]
MSSAPHSEYRRVSAQPDEHQLLRSLIDAGDAFVSGSDLAKMIGLSRPAVWGKIKKLQESGFEIEAVRNRGYRITAQPEVLHPTLLQIAAEDCGLEMDCLYFPVLDSTNNEAERQIANGRAGPFAVLSSCQTKGRGRLGREWFSGSAENLYLTVTYEPRLPSQKLQHFTLWCGIQICRALQALLPDNRLEIKWPNDLHCAGHKFAGMLTEAKLDADGLKALFFGLGLNVNSNPVTFPKELHNRATSLQAISGKALSINAVAALALKAIQDAYNICIQNPDTESNALLEAWKPYDGLFGREVVTEQAGQTIKGIARGIDSSGALMLDAAEGKQASIRAGDVTLSQF